MFVSHIAELSDAHLYFTKFRKFLGALPPLEKSLATPLPHIVCQLGCQFCLYACCHFCRLYACNLSVNYVLGRGRMCEKFRQLLAVGRWFPPGTPVSSTRELISSSFHRLDMTLAVAEALNPNKPYLSL